MKKKCTFVKMNSIFEHIENLLIKNDYVIVPNFGGFISQQQTSKIQGNTIQPPLSVVGFNPLLQHSDGLLEMEIARTEHVTYRQAVEIISDNVTRIKKILQYGETINFGQIGEIRQNKETLVFIPASDFRFLPANFGLHNVDFHCFNKKNKNVEKPVTLTLYPQKILRYAASIALILGMLGLQPFLDRKPQQANFVNMLNNIKTVQEFNSANTAKFVTENQNIATEQAVTIVEKEEVITKNFHLIAGCFQSQKSAEQYVNLLKDKKIETEITVLSSTNLKRVSIGSFATLEEAKTALKNLKNSDKEFENVWIMCKKM